MTVQEKSAGETKAKAASQKKKSRLTSVEKLSDEELQSLRLDEAGTAQFADLRRQITLSREELQAFEAEDAAAMDDARYDSLSASQTRMTKDTTAMVHFLAPRVMKLREGEVKRKWRSFVTKLQKDSKSS